MSVRSGVPRYRLEYSDFITSGRESRPRLGASRFREQQVDAELLEHLQRRLQDEAALCYLECLELISFLCASSSSG